MLQVYRHKAPKELREKYVITTLGNFDGLHKGHQTLLAKVQERKRRAEENGKDPFNLMICFYPHPRETLVPGVKIPRLLDLPSKLSVLSHFGIDGLLLLHFTKEFSRITALSFFKEFLLKDTCTHELVVGPDACIGHNREGDIEWLSSQCQASGVKLHTVEAQQHLNSKIGSSDIRDVIHSGDVSQVESLFGWPYRITGKVLHGSNVGEGLGFPTANIKPRSIIYPRYGVYACFVQYNDHVHQAVVNVGVRPTFGGEEPVVEAHLLDVKGIDLYRKRISIYFIDRLRDERKFSSAQELQRQIQKDIGQARDILDERGNFRPPLIFFGTQ